MPAHPADHHVARWPAQRKVQWPAYATTTTLQSRAVQVICSQSSTISYCRPSTGLTPWPSQSTSHRAPRRSPCPCRLRHPISSSPTEMTRRSGFYASGARQNGNISRCGQQDMLHEERCCFLCRYSVGLWRQRKQHRSSYRSS